MIRFHLSHFLDATMKIIDKKVLLALLFVAGVVFILSIFSLFAGSLVENRSKFFATFGLLLVLSGLAQLEVSGFFSKIIEHYDNESRYPFGPPSSITREIIDNPDTPARTAVRNVLFFTPRTGFLAIVSGTIVQIVALWI